jgi:general secretion pathway protein N
MAVIRLMRPFRIFLAISSALTATTAAGQPARPAPVVEGPSAPATEGTAAADPIGLSGAPRAPNPGAKSRAGSSLWTVPLSTLSATRDRPLFSAPRRPPIVAVPVVAPSPKQEALAPPPPERPLLTLIGTIVSRKASVAILQGQRRSDIRTPAWASERRLAGARDQFALNRC